MRNRVKIENTKFHVDTENKVVVCVLKCDMQMYKHPAWFAIDENMWKKKFPKVSHNGKFTVSAIARCNASDTFDVSLGKRIAEGRAKSKMFKTSFKVWQLCTSSLIKMANECLTTSNACSKAQDIENMHVLELTK